MTPTPATALISAVEAGNSPANPAASPLASPDPPPGDPSDRTPVPNASEQAATQVGEDSKPHTQGLGAIIYNALGGSGPQDTGQRSEATSETNKITLPSYNTQQVTTVESHVLSIDASDIAFEGITYSPGGPAMTLSSNIFTVVPHSDSDHGLANDGFNGQVSNLPMASTPLVVGGHTLVPNPSGVIIDGHTLHPGSSAFTISNTPISLGSSGLLAFGSSSIVLPTEFILAIGSQTFTTNPTGFPLDAGSVAPGGPVETIDGTPITPGSSGILAMGTSKLSLPENRAFTVAGQLITPNPSTFPIAGTAISAGGPAVTVDGTVVSLDPTGVLTIGSSTFSLPTPTPAASVNQPLVIAGQTITPSGSAFLVLGTTLSPGGPTVTVDGTVVSLNPSGVLAIGSSTFTLPTPAPDISANQPLVIAGQTITPDGSAFSVAGTTLSPGGPAVTINGTVVSLQPSGTLVVGSDSFALLTSSISIYDIGGLSVQAESSFAMVNGVAVSPGAAGVTAGGSIVSLEPGGKTLDVGSGRFAMPTASVNGTVSLQTFDVGQGKGRSLSIQTILGAWIFLLGMLW